MTQPVYDRIGRGYANTRRVDPRIAARIEAALGNARSVLNVGAGTGSYEPVDREVTAVEPSAEMISQRPVDAAPADYFSEMLNLQRPSGASSRDLAAMLPAATSAPIPVSRDCTDHFFAALWGRPECSSTTSWASRSAA